MWNEDNLIQNMNFSCHVHFLWQLPLHHRCFHVAQIVPRIYTASCIIRMVWKQMYMFSWPNLARVKFLYIFFILFRKISFICSVASFFLSFFFFFLTILIIWKLNWCPYKTMDFLFTFFFPVFSNCLFLMIWKKNLNYFVGGCYERRSKGV